MVQTVAGRGVGKAHQDNTMARATKLAVVRREAPACTTQEAAGGGVQAGEGKRKKGSIC